MALQLDKIALQLDRIAIQLGRLALQLHGMALQLGKLPLQLDRVVLQLHGLAMQLYGKGLQPAFCGRKCLTGGLIQHGLILLMVSNSYIDSQADAYERRGKGCVINLFHCQPELVSGSMLLRS